MPACLQADMLASYRRVFKILPHKMPLLHYLECATIRRKCGIDGNTRRNQHLASEQMVPVAGDSQPA